MNKPEKSGESSSITPASKAGKTASGSGDEPTREQLIEALRVLGCEKPEDYLEVIIHTLRYFHHAGFPLADEDAAVVKHLMAYFPALWAHVSPPAQPQAREERT